MNAKTQQELLEIVNNNYKEIAQEFDQTRQKNIWPPLLDLTKNIKISENILDVGCGNGRLLEVLPLNINYLGLDKSSELIKLAQKNYPQNNFKTADILELDKIKENNFDYVFCVAVLHHLPGSDLQIRALKNLKNKLKPDGKIILSVWNLWEQKKYRKLIWKFNLLKLLGKNKMDWGDILFNWKEDSGSQRYYHAFTRQDLKKISKKANLKIEKIFKDRYNYYLVLGKK